MECFLFCAYKTNPTFAVQLPDMKSPKAIQSTTNQYLFSALTVLTVGAICYPFSAWIGYRTVSLMLLLTVSILAMWLSIGPVTVAAVLSAMIWDFFFIPPHFTFTVGNAEDGLMLLMYFIIALLNGILTFQMRHYERIAQKRASKEKALQLYNTLFNSLSHELRTPIATILAASDNLLSENQPWSASDKKQMNLEINTATQRLNRLVDNLLNVSRLESGYIVLKWDWCDLSELIAAAVGRLSPEAYQERVEISISEQVPLVRLDFVLMEQAIFNLLHNALTYNPEGAKVSISATYQQGQLTLVVVDHGPGFNPEDLPRVFEKFYRPKGSKAGGLGLGLSIVKGVVEAHHGSIELRNQVNTGASIQIIIPTGHLDPSIQPN